MSAERNEQELLHSVALQNASSILAARQRAEEELHRAKDALQEKSDALARSLAMMHATLESTTDGILVTDGDGRVTGLNEAFLKMWAIPQDALQTKLHRKLVEVTSRQFKDPGGFRARIEEIYKTAPAESYDVLEPADGRVIERFSRIQFLESENIGRVWSFRDVTDRRRSERARFQLAAIVDSSNDAIISKSLDGIITSWNEAATRMFGHSAAEAIGKPITLLIPKDRLDEERDIIERLRRGERVEHFDTVRVRKDGTQFHVALTISPIKDSAGKIIGASKIARDITDRKLAAQEREALLEAERAARGQAERASLLKDEFLASVSHELRTPLNAVLGWAQLLNAMSPTQEDLKEGLDTIWRNARQQAQLIEDLLDMSRIASGKMRLDVQQTDLADVIQQSISTVRPSADAKGIHLRQIIDPRVGPVTGDPNRLQQVVWNLLSNAIKFTSKDGKVEVLLRRVNSHVEIAVSDSGMGIKPELLPHVFERFRQGDASSTRKHGGLGLGLAIVKQLIELHGGTVRVHSEGEGHGTTFTVSLPLAPVREDSRRVHPSTPGETVREIGDLKLGGIKVLVIEDESDARELIKRVLIQREAEVFTASGAMEALETLKANRPDVMVSDIGMPDMDGLQFIRQVRKLPASEGGQTPAVALTAFARSEDRTRALMAGYQIHISKPIEPQELIATVASLAGRTTK